MACVHLEFLNTCRLELFLVMRRLSGRYASVSILLPCLDSSGIHCRKSTPKPRMAYGHTHSTNGIHAIYALQLKSWTRKRIREAHVTSLSRPISGILSWKSVSGGTPYASRLTMMFKKSTGEALAFLRSGRVTFFFWKRVFVSNVP